MICRYCKTENPDGATHCSGCGANLDARPNQVLSRRVYLVEEAQPSVKNTAKVIPFAMIVAVLAIAVSACMCLFGSFFDIPFISGFKTEREMAQMRGAFEDAQKQADAQANTALDMLLEQRDASDVQLQFSSQRDNGINSNERILELHKAGKSNMAIAKELGLGIGEVKLVIDLYKGLR